MTHEQAKQLWSQGGIAGVVATVLIGMLSLTFWAGVQWNQLQELRTQANRHVSINQVQRLESDVNRLDSVPEDIARMRAILERVEQQLREMREQDRQERQK